MRSRSKSPRRNDRQDQPSSSDKKRDKPKKLSKKDIQELITKLKSNDKTCVDEEGLLDLSQRGLTFDSTKRILGGLHCYRHMRSLDLSYNRIGGTGLSLLAPMLSRIPNLRCINVSYNGVTTDSAKEFASFLQFNFRVVSLIMDEDTQLLKLSGLMDIGKQQKIPRSVRKEIEFCLKSNQEFRKFIDNKTNTLRLNGRGIVATTVVGFRLKSEWIPRLTKLDLKSNLFTTLPRNLKQFTNLQSLDFSRNQLEEVSENIGLLLNLRHVNFSYNHLTALPDSICSLTKLTKLNLAHNELISLPSSMGLLTGRTELVRLRLHSNPLPSIPAEVKEDPTQLRDYITSTMPPPLEEETEKKEEQSEKKEDQEDEKSLEGGEAEEVKVEDASIANSKAVQWKEPDLSSPSSIALSSLRFGFHRSA